MIDIDAMAYSQSFTLHKQQVDKGQSLRPKADGEVFGEGQLAPSPPAMGLGERCQLPQRGLGLLPRSETFASLYMGSVVVLLIFYFPFQ